MKNVNNMVVGIGYSAGGLAPLKEFIAQLPGQPHATFVIVYHIHRTSESFLTQILSKLTDMPIDVIENGMPVENNHIYVLPADKYVMLDKNVLVLKDRPVTTNINAAIDTFFTSLANSRKNSAVGIILSGAGQDGAKGVAAIHQQGGKVFIQSPVTADFGSMPMHAILADDPHDIDSVRQLAKELIVLLSKKESNTVRGYGNS